MSMIKVENLSFTYPGSYDPIFEQVNFLSPSCTPSLR